MYWAAGIAVAVLTAFLVWASADVGSGVYLKALCRRRSGRSGSPNDGAGPAGCVALTFDDGPDPTMTPRVLEVLRRHGVQATFFLIGERVTGNPELVRRIVAEGHTVGNHTFTHSPCFPLWRGSRVRQELAATGRAVEAAAGVRMRLFRPPFGVTNPVIGRAVREAGLQPVGWSRRSLDTFAWRRRGAVCRSVCRRLRDGDVILLHDRCEGADRLLDALIVEIKARGQQFVTVDRLFDTDAYEK